MTVRWNPTTEMMWHKEAQRCADRYLDLWDRGVERDGKVRDAIEYAAQHGITSGNGWDIAGLIASRMRGAKKVREHVQHLIDNTKIPNGSTLVLYRFWDAPLWMRELSMCGGDEDWIAHVHPDKEEPWWFEDRIGTGESGGHVLPDGSELIFGAH